MWKIFGTKRLPKNTSPNALLQWMLSIGAKTSKIVLNIDCYINDSLLKQCEIYIYARIVKCPSINHAKNVVCSLLCNSRVLKNDEYRFAATTINNIVKLYSTSPYLSYKLYLFFCCHLPHSNILRNSVTNLIHLSALILKWIMFSMWFLCNEQRETTSILATTSLKTIATWCWLCAIHAHKNDFNCSGLHCSEVSGTPRMHDSIDRWQCHLWLKLILQMPQTEIN